MIKKIMAVLMTFVLSMSLVGCSNDSSDKKTTSKKTTTSSSTKIKDVSDFQEFDGMIKYFTRTMIKKLLFLKQLVNMQITYHK